MTEFEFVQVTIALILGLGFTDILRNLGEQFRRRNDLAIYPLQVMASCLLLLVILAYLWFFWTSAQLKWTLPLFLLQVGSAVALAFSAQTIKVDCDSPASPEAQYFGNCTATYGSWAMAPLIGVVFSLVSGTSQGPDPLRAAIVILLLSLAFFKRPNYHKAVGSVLLLAVLVAPFVVQFEL